MTRQRQDYKDNNVGELVDQIDFTKLQSMGDMVSCIYYLLNESKKDGLLSISERLDDVLMQIIKEAHDVYYAKDRDANLESSEYIQSVIDDDMAFIEHFCSITDPDEQQDIMTKIRELY